VKNVTGVPINKNSILYIYVILFLLAGAFFAFSGGGYYTADSVKKLNDMVEIKIWLFLSIIMAALIYNSSLDKTQKLWAWIFALAFYFVIFYALLFKGTDYGMNGHWGDNGNRLALVTKFREFASPFQDWYYKNLPSFYPPLWLYLQGKLAWLFGIEGYKTIKYGYFVIYALYPVMLFYVWSKVGLKSAAFVIAFLTLFLRDIHLDYVYYEHITAAFFVPWWLYFVEDVRNRKNKGIGWYVLGGFLGALIFMTYYFWFFIGIISIFLRPALQLLLGRRGFLETSPFKTKLLMLSAVAVFSSIYWLPLVISIIQYGADSMQNKWFHLDYLDFRLPIFNYSLDSLIYITGLIYLALRIRKPLNGRYILFLASMLVLYLIDRMLNIFETSIQARKILELFPVFLTVSAGYGVAFLFRYVRIKRPKMKLVILVVSALFIIVYGNSHTEITTEKHYKNAINQRPPVNDINILKTVDYRGKVFLTNHYLEAVYLPYYFFLGHWGPAAHTASRFDKRIAFLRYVGDYCNDARTAFLLRNNCLDPVDYFYLPTDDTTKTVYFDVYPLYYPAITTKLRLEFPETTTTKSKYFKLRHKFGIYSIDSPAQSILELFGKTDSPVGLSECVSRFNRLNMAVNFLPKIYADSLRPYLSRAGEELEDSVSFEPEICFDKGIKLLAIKAVSDAAGHSKLRMIFATDRRIGEDYTIFCHAYPVNKDMLESGRESYGFVNCDIYPVKMTSKWIEGEYQLLEKSLDLKPGRYKFHIGLFSRKEGRLPRTYYSSYFNIGEIR